MLARIIKFFIGITIIPLAIGASMAFLKMLSGIDYAAQFSNSQLFLWGVAGYTGMHIFLFKPQYLYTVGHEVVHVLSTVVCGGRVKSFRITKDGGQVAVTKNNFFISLSPYLVPFYTLIIAGIYFTASLFYDISSLSSYFIFLVGFTMSFHIVSTVEVLRLEQPDILRTGYLFSMTLIYVTNVVLIATVVSLLFPELSVEAFFQNSFAIAKDIYVRALNQLFAV